MPDESFERKSGLHGGLRRGRPRSETRTLQLHVRPESYSILNELAGPLSLSEAFDRAMKMLSAKLENAA